MYMVKNKVYGVNVVIRVVSKRNSRYQFFLYLRLILLEHCYFWLSSDWKTWNEQILPKSSHPDEVYDLLHIISMLS